MSSSNPLEIFVDSDTVLTISGLAFDDGTSITDGAVSLTAMVDRNGDAVAGVGVPISLVAQGDGSYEGRISSAATIYPGMRYYLTFQATKSGYQRTWKLPGVGKAGRSAA